MKTKKHSPTWFRKKCVDWAKKQAKQRDKYTCQYCGKKAEGSGMHGSHILPEGSYPLMSAEPDNIIALCAEHHLGGISPHLNRQFESWHSHPVKFGLWFNRKWPGRYKALRSMADEKRKHIVNWEKEYNLIK